MRIRLDITCLLTFGLALAGCGNNEDSPGENTNGFGAVSDAGTGIGGTGGIGGSGAVGGNDNTGGNGGTGGIGGASSPIVYSSTLRTFIIFHTINR